MGRKRTLEEFKKQASKVHNNFYLYDRVLYVDDSTKVIVTCPIHGNFNTTPTNHIHRKSGCDKCFRERLSKLHAMKIEDFISKADNIHNSKMWVSHMQKISWRT
jgi:hypothetical protein